MSSINKANDLKRVFANWHDGNSLNRLINKAEEAYQDGSSYLLVIEDTEEGVLGAYFMHELTKTSMSKKVGSAENFVFSLKEEFVWYKGRSLQATYFEFDGHDMYIGPGKTGCALLIDSDLKECHTAKSDVFNNEILTPSGRRDFEIKYIELFVFV